MSTLTVYKYLDDKNGRSQDSETYEATPSKYETVVKCLNLVSKMTS